MKTDSGFGNKGAHGQCKGILWDYWLPKEVSMDTVFCRGRHMLGLVRLGHVHWLEGHAFVGPFFGCIWKKGELWSKSLRKNLGKRRWPGFKMKTGSGFGNKGAHGQCKGILWCYCLMWTLLNSPESPWSMLSSMISSWRFIRVSTETGNPFIKLLWAQNIPCMPTPNHPGISMGDEILTF